MNTYTLNRKALLIYCIFISNSFLLFAEGGKNLTPSNNGITNYTQATPLNNSIGALQNGDNNPTNNFTGYFLYSRTTAGVFAGDPAFTTDHRLKIRMKPGEVLYYGVQRTDGRHALTLRIMADIAGVETVLQSTTFADNNNIINTYTGANRNVDVLNCGQPGVICNAAQMNAGPAAIVGAAGYNALAVSLPAAIITPTDVWVEFWDDAGGVCRYDEKDVYDLWDFSVYSGTTERPGRMHSKMWAFQAMTLQNRLSDNFVLFPAIPNDAGNAFFIKGLNLRGMQAFGFSFVCNATGTLTNTAGVPTTDFRERRKSKLNFPGVRTDIYPQYNIFVNDPDIEFWPTGDPTVPVLPFNVNSWCADPATGRGSLLATIRFLFPAIIQIYGELNGVPGYQPLTADVLFEVENTSGLGYIFWNGLDGLGNIVPSGTILNVRYRVQRYPVHFPIYDPENNDLGFRIEDRRPFPNGTVGFAYWDDTQIVPGSSSLVGTPSGSGVHPWGGTGTGINAPNVGNINLMNTWGFGAVREVPLLLPFIFRCDSDNDGDPDNLDIDDDDDGIIDVDESPAVDAILDSDGDGIVDYVDLSFPGYIDVNFDGINDNFDKDGDRIINQLDLDSDNDGIPDVVESYGVDNDGNGRIDNYTDTDNDGLSQNVDQSMSVNPLASVGLGEPDMDGDGLPNYLDRDSDNDGIPDLVEAGGADTNNNGLVDDLTDLNGDGVISPLIGESLADTDRDGLSNSKDADADNNGTMENMANAILRTSTDTNGNGRPETYPFKNTDLQTLPNPYDIDSDNDGITDVREAGFTDADNNGISDGVKGTDGWDDTIDALPVLTLLNTDGTMGPNYIDIDADNDGIPDNVEGMSTAGYILPSGLDTDGDGLDNSYDATAGFGGNGNIPNNHDRTDLPDYLDTDTDNDAVIDLYEGNDLNFDGIVNDVPALTGTDTDGDGLQDFFDNDNSSSKGTSRYMGNRGTTTGDIAPGGITTVQRNSLNSCTFERDWRCVDYVLPLEILSFTGAKQGNAVKLQWQISTTESLEKTIVEKSFDGRNFTIIKEITATDAPAAVQSFNYTDADPAINEGKVFYRIIAVSKSGRFAASQVISFVFSVKTVVIKLLPNPVHEILNVNINISKNISAKLNIIDMNGRIMQSRHAVLSAGLNSIQFHFKNIAEGSYILQVITAETTWNEKFLVLVK